MAAKDKRTRAELLEALKKREEEYSRLVATGVEFAAKTGEKLRERDRAITDLESKLARAMHDTRRTQDALRDTALNAIKTGHHLEGKAEGLTTALRILIEKKGAEDEEDPVNRVLAKFDELLEELDDHDL